MHDAPMAVPVAESSEPELMAKADREVVSTHVLVEQEKVEKLRELSKRTRIAQSEYLREAVDDLLTKYDRKEED
ncbi:MAG: ribbon-helix-helix domain-containing protein [Myxococcus sp.]|nr:ribbon-helix-helix domain-containing protein [Myxococcus sp.]